jgi:hypothetical protein
MTCPKRSTLKAGSFPLLEIVIGCDGRAKTETGRCQLPPLLCGRCRKHVVQTIKQLNAVPAYQQKKCNDALWSEAERLWAILLAGITGKPTQEEMEESKGVIPLLEALIQTGKRQSEEALQKRLCQQATDSSYTESAYLCPWECLC